MDQTYCVQIVDTNSIPDNGRRPKLELSGSLLKFSQHKADVNLDRNTSWFCSPSNFWNVKNTKVRVIITAEWHCRYDSGSTRLGGRQFDPVASFQTILRGRHPVAGVSRTSLTAVSRTVGCVCYTVWCATSERGPRRLRPEIGRMSNLKINEKYEIKRNDLRVATATRILC